VGRIPNLELSRLIRAKMGIIAFERRYLKAGWNPGKDRTSLRNDSKMRNFERFITIS